MAASRQLKRLHKELSLEKKIELIKASGKKPKRTQEQLGEEFGIGRSTVSDILRKRESYQKQWEENRSSKRQRLNKPTRLDSLRGILQTGVFYRSLPDKTLACKGHSVKGGKHSKGTLNNFVYLQFNW